MSKRPPNRFIAPIVIAGITAGFFISAYKFVFAKAKQADKQRQKRVLAEQSIKKDEK